MSQHAIENGLKYFLLDVFTESRFGGNPLAVFPEADTLTGEQMQQIAGELNLSETTFIRRAKERDSDCTVRIFTPRSEVPLAGHPTIGTAWTILKNNLLKPRHEGRLIFDLGVGPVSVDFTMANGEPRDLVMHQRLPDLLRAFDKTAVAETLSLKPSDIEDDSPVQLVSCGLPIVLVPVKSLDALGRASVRLDLLDETLGGTECRELFVFTCRTESPDVDVRCRFFAPRYGVTEDPATGGAHGPLGSYLVKYGLNDGERIISEQGVEMGRRSTIKVHIETRGDEIVDVAVSGDCVEVGTGCMRVD